jgi:hypothetical protein
MPLWYDSGLGLRPTSFERNNLNLDVFFCCSGPSLGLVDSKKLNGPGRLVVAVNNAYPHVRPDIWFGMEDPSCYPRELFWESFMKVMRGGYNGRRCEGREISRHFNLYYADVAKLKEQEDIFRIKGEEAIFAWNNNVMAVALHVLFWMGVKRIHLLGCDLNNKEKDYCHDQKLNPANKAWAASLYNDLYGWLQWLVPAAARHGIRIKSCTPESRVNNIMEYVELDRALTESQRDIPLGKELIYGKDVK